jgi:hypothetical protein
LVKPNKSLEAHDGRNFSAFQHWSSCSPGQPPGDIRRIIRLSGVRKALKCVAVPLLRLSPTHNLNAKHEKLLA